MVAQLVAVDLQFGYRTPYLAALSVSVKQCESVAAGNSVGLVAGVVPLMVSAPEAAPATCSTNACCRDAGGGNL